MTQITLSLFTARRPVVTAVRFEKNSTIEQAHQLAAWCGGVFQDDSQKPYYWTIAISGDARQSEASESDDWAVFFGGNVARVGDYIIDDGDRFIVMDGRKFNAWFSPARTHLRLLPEDLGDVVHNAEPSVLEVHMDEDGDICVIDEYGGYVLCDREAPGPNVVNEIIAEVEAFNADPVAGWQGLIARARRERLNGN